MTASSKSISTALAIFHPGLAMIKIRLGSISSAKFSECFLQVSRIHEFQPLRQNADLSAVRYAPYTSSWLRRRYGLFNGRGAFGPPWLPISSWFGSLLSRLLECPGFARYDFDFRLADGFDLVALTHLLDERIHRLEQLYGRASYTPLLPASVPKSFMRPAT